MGKNEPSKPTSSVKFGDRNVSNSYWSGNDYVTQFNPTAQEQKGFDYLNASLPDAFRQATDNSLADNYGKNWANQQVSNYNKLANSNLTTLKDGLITGGQVGSSTGWGKIKAFNDSYNDTISNISQQAPLASLDYQNSLLNRANNLSNSMKGYYDLGSNFTQQAGNQQQVGWNQQLQADQMAMQKQQAMMNNIYGGINAAAGLGGALLGSGGIGSLAGKLAGNVGGKGKGNG